MMMALGRFLEKEWWKNGSQVRAEVPLWMPCVDVHQLPHHFCIDHHQLRIVFGQLPTRTIPHHTGIPYWHSIWTTPQEDNSPPYRFWSWWVVLFCGSGPSGELSQWGIVLGIVVLVGNGWALFLSGGELSSWGVVLEPGIGPDGWFYSMVVVLVHGELS